MTKEQLVELVKKRLGDDGRYGDRTISKNIALAFNQVLLPVFQQSIHNMDRYSKSYPKTVQQDQVSKIYYVDLPEGTMQSPDIGNGIRDVTALEDVNLEFVPIRYYMAKTLKNIDAGIVGDKIGYYVRNSRLEFYKHKPEIKDLLVDAVVGFDYWEWEDNIDFPIGTAEQIVGLTLQFLEGQPYIPLHQRRINIEEEK